MDPYVGKRQTSANLKTYKTPSDFDKLKQFVEMDRKVLRFFCIWDDRDNMFGELRKFIIHVSSQLLYFMQFNLQFCFFVLCLNVSRVVAANLVM